MKKVLLAVALVATAVSSQAQVRVIESTPQSARSGGVQAAGDGNIQSEMFYQLQLLQQEVAELRGLFEEQAHELQRLQQRRLDDYMDLDRRISALSGGAASGAPASGSAPSAVTPGGALPPSSLPSPALPTPSPHQSQQDESAVYQAAFDLLRRREIDASTNAFKAHLAQFPNGRYAANSYYWLGEIYLLNNDLESARTWFADLLERFPGDRKVPDAEYKLATVYFQQGERERARRLMEQVASGTSDAARLARRYLEENF